MKQELRDTLLLILFAMLTGMVILAAVEMRIALL